MLVKKISNGKHYAMKILKKKDFYKNEKSEESVKTEKMVLMKSKHPFIVQLHYSFQDKTSLYYVLDYIEGGELFKYLRQKKVFSFEETVFYAAEVLLALSYLHDKLNTIYRDLKPENILVDKDGHIKLTDFGLSKSKFIFWSNQKLESRYPTPFAAPVSTSPLRLSKVAFLRPLTVDLGHTKLVDFWTFGVLIFEMICGRPPFRHKNQTILYNKITSASYVMPPDIHPDAQSIIRALLNVDVLS